MEFKQDSFTSRIPTFKRILKKFNGKQCNYLEIGVREGMSFCWVAQNILTHKDCNAFAIDIWRGESKNRFDENIKELSTNVTAIQGDSIEELKKLLSKDIQFDFVYIDGNHTSEYVVTEASLVWTRLKKDGIIIFDDYGWKAKERSNNPKIGIDAFVESFKQQIEVLHVGWQYIIKKTT